MDFEAAARPRGADALTPDGHGLTYIDHLTHNVHRGRMDEWAGFYERLFNFREIRYFDIEGQVTGVKSKAMTSPCGKIRIPINEEGNEKAGQIQEYLDSYQRRGHPAHRHGLRRPVRHGGRAARQRREAAGHHRHLLRTGRQAHPGPRRKRGGRCKKRKILVDGKKGALLLQIFSENQLGPIFFEFIQRKGDDGFGEGNFKALFESIELDQMRRGVLADGKTGGKAGEKAGAQ